LASILFQFISAEDQKGSLLDHQHKAPQPATQKSDQHLQQGVKALQAAATGPKSFGQFAYSMNGASASTLPATAKK
jgi:hypothetical protein